MTSRTPLEESVKPILDTLLGEAAFAYLAKSRALAEKGRDVINFGIGQPDIPTPRHIVEEAKRALDAGYTGYTETAGIPELREAIAEYLNNRYGSDTSRDEVIVTTGAKTAIFLAVASTISPGDEVIVPEPSYPAYPEVARFMGASVKYIPLKWLGQEKGFELDIEAIEEAITPRTKMIVVNNPHNPSGAVFPPNQVDELMDIARRHRLLLLVDEIYDNFVYGEVKFKSFLEHSDWRSHVLYVNGFSKTFSMTGWRLGYLVVDKRVAEKIIRLAVNVYSCPVNFVQHAGIVALRGDWEPVRRMIEKFRERRDAIVEELRKVPGFETAKPAGAFYVFPRIARVLEETGMSVEEFVDHILYSKAVTMLPGTAFPDKAGREYVRLSFAVDIERIREGVRRIRDEVEKLLTEKTRR
ncbi:MAG: pyridoxal phosphate-dependent aminotransferase [Pyrodictiaceae archaeon]